MSRLPVFIMAAAACALAADTNYSNAPDQELLVYYQQLRTVGLDSTRSFALENTGFESAEGSFHFKTGSLYLLAPVGGRIAGAVFIGEGNFSLKPRGDIERNQLKRFTDGQPELDEPFRELVLIATDQTLTTLTAGLNARAVPVPPRAADLLENFRKMFRETLRTNIEARVLAGFCSPRERMQLADIHGQKRGRFLFINDTQSEEEVQLLHSAGRNNFDIWASSHPQGGLAAAERALVDTTATKIDITLEKNGKLSASAEMEFTSLAPGARLLYARLAPMLRVLKITTEAAELKFIQEDKKKDADLWVILPKPSEKGRKCVWKVEYAGDDVVEGKGGGNFYVGSRTSWYPKLDIPGDTFTDRAIYQLTFHSPKDLTLVATGKLIRRATEGKLAVSEWNTEIPFPVVGFNYGKFKSKSVTDGGAEITVYANEGLNDDLRQMQMLAEDKDSAQKYGISGSINTTGMANAALVEAANSVRIYSRFFGPLAFPALSISQQPAMSYGQSWPTLIFMPYTAFLDATIRNQWGISDDKSTRQFLEEVGPHEVAHQWWAHTVGTKTYHDEWLSEGFADYSAGLYLQVTGGDAKFRKYLEAKKEAITSPLADSSMRACDAGPIWLGRRLSTDKHPDAYQRIVYSKGAYVLHMLRVMLMNISTRDDSRFIAMMRDFVQTYRGREASTEDFQAIVEKHFGGDASWFFNQWVYGSEYPKVTVQYSVTPNEKGALFHGAINQTGVSKQFRTILPFIAYIGKGGGSGKLLADGESTPFSMQLPGVPDRIEFNALYGALCDLEVKKI